MWNRLSDEAKKTLERRHKNVGGKRKGKKMIILSVVLSIIAILISGIALYKSTKTQKPVQYKSGVYHFDETHEAAAIRRKSE